MKFIVISDIHGNLPALQAVLDAIQAEDYDFIVHLGDVIAIGPFPSECLQLMFQLPNCHLLMGNHDAWFAQGLPHPQPVWMSDGEVEHQLWTHRQIAAELRAKVRQWPYVIEDIYQGVSVIFLHYALNSSGDDFLPILQQPTSDDLDSLFAPYQTDLIFYGHHHPFSDIKGRARYINPGSLGCFTQPIARYTIINCHQGKFEIEHRQVPYDDQLLLQAFEERKVPEREFLYKAFFGNRF